VVQMGLVGPHNQSRMNRANCMPRKMQVHRYGVLGNVAVGLLSGWEQLQVLQLGGGGGRGAVWR
jgi:hypothetical protein